MRYIILKNDDETVIELSPIETGYDVQIGGEKHKVSVAKITDGAYSLIMDGKSFELAIHKEQGEPYIVHLPDGAIRKVELLTPIEAVARKHKKSSGKGSGEVKSPMPGRIVKVLVAKGQNVKAGEALVVVEAMKMQNQLVSPFDGLVKETRVKDGESVERNGVVAVVEKTGAADQ